MINGVRIILGPVGIWKRPGRNLKPTDEEVLAQDELADRAVQLVLHILRYRLGALSTWCESWPGLLALLASDDDAGVDRCLEKLREDYAVLQEVKELGKASKFLAGLAKMSPLNTAPTRELAELVAAGELSRSQRAHLRDGPSALVGVGANEVLRGRLQRAPQGRDPGGCEQSRGRSPPLGQAPFHECPRQARP